LVLCNAERATNGGSGVGRIARAADTSQREPSGVLIEALRNL
jgi:hypothetical protein